MYVCIFFPLSYFLLVIIFVFYHWIPSDVCLSAHIELQVTNIDGDFCLMSDPC